MCHLLGKIVEKGDIVSQKSQEIEYALILGLIAVLAVLALMIFPSDVSSILSSIVQNISEVK